MLDTLRRADLVRTKNLINGQWMSAAGDRTFAVTDPADDAKLVDVANSGAADARTATDAGYAALPAWREKLPRERAEILRRWHALIVANTDDLARIISSEQGKPLAEARGEVAYGAGYVAWFADEAAHVHGDIIAQQQRGKKMIGEGADQRGRGDHTVEFPARDDCAQDRAGTRGRLHGGRKAGRRHAAHRARACRACAGSGRAARRPQPDFGVAR